MNIEITKTIAASPETVFRALTDADELNRWWTSSADSDARTGGEYSYRFEFEDASRNHTYTGAYEEITPNERVRFPWQTSLGGTTVEFRVRPSGDGTELVLVHSGWGQGEEWESFRRNHEEGWGFFLDNLKSVLESGEDGRAAGPMRQKTGAAAQSG